MFAETTLLAGPWEDALTALTLHAIDPEGTVGVILEGGPGPARDAWLSAFAACRPGAPVVRVPGNTPDARLVGGLDLPATLAAGRPVEERGLLASADGGTIVLGTAERLSSGFVARIAQALEAGEVRLERDGLASRHPTRFGVVALHEGGADEAPHPALLERLAFRVDLRDVTFDELEHLARPDPAEIERARAVAAAGVAVDDDAIRMLCEASVLLGVDSIRALQTALAAARAAAALDGEREVDEEHVGEAIRRVLLPRATRMPARAPEEEEEQAPPEPPEAGPEDAAAQASPDALEAGEPDPPEDGALPEEARMREADVERLVESVLASIPRDLLARLDAQARAGGGRAGGRSTPRRERAHERHHGRPLGARRGRPGGGVRLDLLETLRAAAPWQRLRGRNPGDPRLEVRGDDLRVVRHRPRTETTTIFAVDASGSTALRRLGEAKGAVERLLAESYVRRDRVALIAFRGARADVLLPPTRSLARAKRELRALPGGGGTPLAAAIEAVLDLGERVRREGGRAVAIFLSDGQANVALDGAPGRGQAAEDAERSAQRLRAAELPTLFVDSSARTRPHAPALAQAMGAEYLLLPGGRSEEIAEAAKGLVRGASSRSASVASSGSPPRRAAG